MIQTFTPIQAIILSLSVLTLIVETYITITDKQKGLLEIPCILLAMDFVAFYGFMLVTNPYDRNDTFLWSQIVRLHTILTMIILAFYRVAELKGVKHG